MKSLIALVAVAATLLANAEVGLAAPTQCIGLLTGTVDGDIVVPDGAACVLDNVAVSGNVTVQTGSSLDVIATSTSTTIRGNIKGHGCYAIGLGDGGQFGHVVIGGDVDISHCTGPVASACSGYTGGTALASVLIGGDVKCADNVSGCDIRACTVAGDLQCSDNLGAGCTLWTATVGGDATLNDNLGITILGNAIGGNLKCNGNGSAVGVANIVAGTKSGQCSVL
jgi:hypothetical protein